MEIVNRQWCVAKPHDDAGMSLAREHFKYHETDVPAPGDGEVMIRTIYLACDPMNHAWVRGIPGRFETIPVGSPMRGGIAGRVIASRHPDYVPGDAVAGFLDWADYSISNGNDHLGNRLQKVPGDLPLASGLATLGMTGLCAYFGLADIGHPMPDETVVISGAAGAIGTIAGQLAKLANARVIGIAGGPRKCGFLVNELGFDAAIDYKSEDVTARLRELCPRGIDIFFDNVGGPLLDAALLNMARRGRIVVCGGTASYNQPAPVYNQMMLAVQGCVMAGFFYFDYVHRFSDGIERLQSLLRAGLIKEVLDVTKGFDSAPDAALGQFHGANLGRKLVQIVDDPSMGS